MKREWRQTIQAPFSWRVFPDALKEETPAARTRLLETMQDRVWTKCQNLGEQHP
jgi:hypothetical protein